MQKQKSFQLAVIGVLAFAVIFMSVGFAAYSQTLNIGDAIANIGDTWSVHFDPNSFQRAEGSVIENSKSISDTAIEYSATLEKPGDKFAFSINVVNDGNLDAVLNKIILSNLTEEQQKHIKYSLTYDNSEDQVFTSTTEGLNIGLPHNTGSDTKNVIVTVSYEEAEDDDDIVNEPIDINMVAELDYNQAD